MGVAFVVIVYLSLTVVRKPVAADPESSNGPKQPTVLAMRAISKIHGFPAPK
jgi:hypothetical protein